MVVNAAHAAVLQEFKRTFPAPISHFRPGVERESYVRRCIRAKKLHPESKVWLLVQGLHSVVYVQSNRKQSSPKGPKPLLGKVYSTFLFDSYRRPYRFGGQPQAVTDAWQQEREASTKQNFESVIAQLFVKAANLDDPKSAQFTQLVEQIETNRQRLEQILDNSRQEMADACVIWRQALSERVGRTYASIDLFLLELVDALTAPLGSRCEAAELIQDAFDILAHANDLRKGTKREAWMLDNADSWRVKRDHNIALWFESLQAKGDPFYFGYADILPRAAEFPRPNITEWRKFKIVHLLTPLLQPISHESVREAARLCNVSKWYFDERQQRNTALTGEVLAHKSLSRNDAQRAHDRDARLRARVALKVPVDIVNPTIAAAFAEQRAAQRERIDLQETFPVFADVPWRVSGEDGRQSAAKHFAYFKTMPYTRGENTGNCNSIAFAFLALARIIEESKHRVKRGTKLRAPGSSHTVRLPVPRTL